MIPLIPALVLAFVSFISSVFVILRIVIPILPPHPLSRRVSPAEFGLPTFRSLSPADKSHLWLASLDIVALALFCWEAVSETTGSPTAHAMANDPLAAVRLWLILNMRQACLLVIAGLSLAHVRLGRSMSYGTKHWMLLSPTLLLLITSTAIAGVVAGARVSTLFTGLLAFTTTVAALSTVAFACLIVTLVAIKRNLTVSREDAEPWPPAKQINEKPRPSFAPEEIDALKDGASWITSNASTHTRGESASQWSFSTHHTQGASSHHGHGRPQAGNHASVPKQSSFWFNATQEDTPPVPPLPGMYNHLSPTSESLAEADPFRRIPSPAPEVPRPRYDSQTSWLTETGNGETLSAWSFPTSRNGSTTNVHTELLPSAADSRPVTPAMSSAQPLGGYGYVPSQPDQEKALASLAAPNGTELDISMYRLVGWSLLIWIPLALSFPYVVTSMQNSPVQDAFSILLALSVTISSPILALNLVFKSPLPIPSGLFDIHDDMPQNVVRGPSPTDSERTYKASHEYKRSISPSVTVVEGRRSGDVWLSKGDAVDGKTKVGRAVHMMSRTPKLSVLPMDTNDDVQQEQPLFEGHSLPATSLLEATPRSEISAQFSRLRNDSSGSHLSAAEESVAQGSRIMVAERHYSAVARTLRLSTSPEHRASTNETVMTEYAMTSSVVGIKSGAHLRARSISSMSGPQTPNEDSFNISPPPSMPLPPTPPNVRARLARQHKKSYSSGFSFGPVNDMNEIDALTAGVLPILVPGLTVGNEMKIKDGRYTPPGTFSKSSKDKKLAKMMLEFGADISSPQVHSTPANPRARELRARKTSQHKRNHWSLPSLGKDGIPALFPWSSEVGQALEGHLGQYTAIPADIDSGRRNTVFGGELAPEHVALLNGTGAPKGALGRKMSTRTLGLDAEVPHGVDAARQSLISAMLPPHSAASTATLFEDLEADLQSGPLAESTPHNSVAHKRDMVESPPPPVPTRPLSKASRRSSIVYIRSEDPTPAVITETPSDSSTTSTRSSFAQWSARAVKPLIPKGQRKNTVLPSSGKSDTPSRGLRPLSLLQERDANVASDIQVSPQQPHTRPLALKKQKSRMPVLDENANPSGSQTSAAPNKGRGLKTLQLARSETSKARGVLRKNEALPQLVIRPPSNAYQFGY